MVMGKFIRVAWIVSFSWVFFAFAELDPRLVQAIEQGSNEDFTKLLKELQNHMDFTDTDVDGNTLLHKAAQHGRLNITHQLIQNIDVRATNFLEQTPLELAIYNGHEDVALFLKINGAEVVDIKVNKHSEEALRQAVMGGKARLVFLLLSAGVNSNHLTNSDGVTLLHSFILQFFLQWNPRIPEMLIKKGLDPNAYAENSLYSGTALHWAVQIQAQHHRFRPALLKDLMELGADTNAVHPMRLQRTPLHWAVYLRDFKVAETLLRHGAKPNITDVRQDSPLHTAVRNGDLKTAALLLEFSADLHAQNQSGDTPLHAAVQSKSLKSILFLINHGADPSVVDKDNKTPLDRAQEMRGRFFSWFSPTVFYLKRKTSACSASLKAL